MPRGDGDAAPTGEADPAPRRRPGGLDARVLIGRAGRASSRLGRSLSLTGLVLATAAFAASTTPSLIPRGWLYQGVISALSLVLGYAVGTTLRWALRRFGVTAAPRGARRDTVRRWLLATLAVVVLVTLLTGTASQRRLATLWGLPTTPEPHLVTTAVTAVGLALVLLAAGRGCAGPGQPSDACSAAGSPASSPARWASRRSSRWAC
ncbi:hypothetical protein C8046_02805 [Serinibacter arcticus]|uniref:Alpha/beta-hydrolase N-terminal domain-containing protein n=1 Tax=Serinibacter arcticus TaxID=1655435 RepID=A0A2U1ZS71_9MICO|nr:hypothetical protein C8046_02805 [Serinibacter arcticus]